jgi:hypothetical protein
VDPNDHTKHKLCQACYNEGTNLLN